MLKQIFPFAVAGFLFYSVLSLTQHSENNLIEESLIPPCLPWVEQQVTNLKLPPNWSESTCSSKATDRGPNQKVITYSFYGLIDNTRHYFQGIERNVILMQQLYPGWTMRLYHDLNGDEAYKLLCDIQTKYYDALDLCYVGDLPGYGNLIGSQENMWRFLVLSDPLVDVMISRDLDSDLSAREVAAVSEWLNSNFKLHIMRDDRRHSAAMLAGMWGAKVASARDVWKTALDNMFYKGKASGPKSSDQKFLATDVWPLGTKKDWLMQHDSWFCTDKRYHRGKILPFPTERLKNGYNFVGSRIGIDKKPVLDICPEKCRKKKKWVHC